MSAMGHQATASSQQVLSPAATSRSHAVTPRGAEAADALLGGEAWEGEGEPLPESEVSPLIRTNQRAGAVLLQAFRKKQLTAYRGQTKDIAQLEELARYGAFRFEGGKVCCLSLELLEMMLALVRSDEVQKQGHPLEILSLMRKATAWDFERERPPNHGRELPRSESMTDYVGRTVVAMSSALDVSGFGGHAINMEDMGPGEGKPLTEADRKRIQARKEAVYRGVAGVLRNLPSGLGRRYTLGLPRPVGADMWRLFPPDFKKTYTLPKDFQYPEDTCHVFLLPDPSGNPVSPTRGYHGDVNHIIHAGARKAVVEALTQAGLHAPRALLKPEPLSTGIVVLVPDGKDHLHITAHRASDDLSRPKHRKKKGGQGGEG
jgi:hypothetical protein